LVCFTTADESSVLVALPEISQTHESATDEAAGFTVLGEVEPRSMKKVLVIAHAVFVNDAIAYFIATHNVVTELSCNSDH